MFIYILIVGIIMGIYEGYKNGKTGANKQALTAKKLKEKALERAKINNKYGYSMDKYSNSAYWDEINSLEEKWCAPGTKAFKEMKEKEAAWKRGERW